MRRALISSWDGCWDRCGVGFDVVDVVRFGGGVGPDSTLYGIVIFYLFHLPTPILLKNAFHVFKFLVVPHFYSR